MSFYRYSASYPKPGGSDLNVRSLVPMNPEQEKNAYYVHRIYTSEKDDSKSSYVISMGLEKGWPEKKSQPRSVDRLIIHYVTDGKGLFCGKPVHAGQFFYTRPYETYFIENGAEDPLKFYYIGISGGETRKIMQENGFADGNNIGEFHFADVLPELFHDALYRQHPAADMGLYLMSIFVRLLAYHKAGESAHAVIQTDNTFNYYKQALIFINESLMDGIDVKDVAEYLHISSSYLRVIFSRFCQYSVRELLIRKRIDCAASKLIFDDYSVMQAAASIGYSDYTLFSRIFKKYTGLSPRDYKKQHCAIEILPKNIHIRKEEGTNGSGESGV